MPFRRIHALLLISAIVLLAIVPIGASAQTKQDVDRAKSQAERAQRARKAAYERWQSAQDDLETAIAHYEDVNQQLEALTYRINQLYERITSYEAEATDLRERAEALVYEAYTNGGTGMVSIAFEASSIQDLLTSQVLIDKATARDLADLDRLDAVRKDMDRQKAELADKQAQVRVLQQQADELVQQMSDLFDEAEHAYKDASATERKAIDNLAKQRAAYKAAEARRKAEAAARARINASGAAAGLPPEATPGFVCPVKGPTSFINSWGFPRSGGRRHKGTDMFAKRGTPVQAVLDGKVVFKTVHLGGTVAYVYADDGNKYYYAHLNGYAKNIKSGQRVKKGTVIGYVGNSGNARYTSPHLHFGIRVGGTRAVNPYPTVRYYCP